ncbi:MAG: methyltransferase domain-containing protein [Candidatus Lokiarchaeota archaeon]|nr:methyltransferase domain-containing protein [Candidatus Harpocratesius repetitus]
MQPIEEGERVYIILDPRRKWIRSVKSSQQFHSDKGFLEYEEIIGKLPGQTFLLKPFHRKVAILRPLISDFIFHMKRQSQIIYPEDIGSILIYGGVNPKSKILEAGTGSGTVTSILAHFCQPNGHVYSFDIRETALNQAKKNIEFMGMTHQTTVDLGNILENDYDFQNINFIMLDLATPWLAVPKVKKYLHPTNGRMCLFSPTLEQVKKNIKALSSEHFSWYCTYELLKRFYQVKPNATRPIGRMVGHTGYLTYAAFYSLDDSLHNIGFNDLYSPENLGNLCIYAQFTQNRRILVVTQNQSPFKKILEKTLQNLTNFTFIFVSQDTDEISQLNEIESQQLFDVICIDNCYFEKLFEKSAEYLENGGVFCGIHENIEKAKEFHLAMIEAHYYDITTSEIIKREIRINEVDKKTTTHILSNKGFLTLGRKVLDKIEIKEGAPKTPENVEMVLEVGRNL